MVVISKENVECKFILKFGQGVGIFRLSSSFSFIISSVCNCIRLHVLDPRPVLYY